MEKLKKFLEKIKFLWQKENRREILYVASTILIIGAVIFLFIWSSMVVVKTINISFIPPVDFPVDILFVDFEGFKKIAPRLGIDIKTVNNYSDMKSEEKNICNQIITSAISPDGGDCKEFPTPCDIPAGWQIIDKCQAESVIKSSENISNIKLEILNGTITPGLAALWKEKFIESGFQSENIKTGNADKKDYQGIVVYHNSTETIFGKISAILNQSDLAVKTEKDEKLDNAYFKIIIGK